MGTLFFGKSVRHIQCNTQRIPIYCRVRIVGTPRYGDGLFIAKKVTVYDISPHSRKLQDGIILEEEPDLSKNRHGWSGKIWMDGYPITVNPRTALIPQPNNTTFQFTAYTTHISVQAKNNLQKVFNSP